MVPRAAVCADRIAEVLDTETSVVAAADAGHRAGRGAASSCSTRVEFSYPGADDPVLRDISFAARPGADHGGHRLDRSRQDARW